MRLHLGRPVDQLVTLAIRAQVHLALDSRTRGGEAQGKGEKTLSISSTRERIRAGRTLSTPTHPPLFPPG